MESYSTLNHARLLDTNRSVCEIQFSQILSFIHASPFDPPEHIRQFYSSMRNRRRQHDKFLLHALHESPSLKTFGTEPTSSQIIVSSPFRTRHLVRDFAADVLDILDGARTPVVWILHKPSSDISEQKLITRIEVVKQLVYQILQKNHTMLDERSFSLSAVRFQSARTENEWFALLGSVLAGFKQIYIVVDTALLGEIEEERLTTTWLKRFRELFAELRNRPNSTVVKVLFINYKPTFTQGLAAEY
ncbi:uncharacterized protein LY89DRAFT_648419 [Mollisia scopiformis]|uniref:Uncharacterized protein n=1 Tax=Mollisia scopiformis TaxID=149040 RepID=A0A194X563_MOLSC|nr:uncharacterized protein LY89DRAFT_648419 [Mollisia scopiformis]KUJ15209.1 hypothetical protein LY89DRAFT_648419 [Mollisia scopiformis]